MFPDSHCAGSGGAGLSPSPPISRWRLYPPSSFKLALATWLALTNGTLDTHREKHLCTEINLLLPQNHPVIQVQLAYCRISSHSKENQSSQLTASTKCQPWEWDHAASSSHQHPTSWPQTRERAQPVSVVTWWVQSRKWPANLQSHEQNKWQCVKPLCFWVVCYTAKASWYKFQEKALFPPHKLPSSGLSWSKQIPITSNQELTETPSAEPGRWIQTAVLSLSSFPIPTVLPLGLHPIIHSADAEKQNESSSKSPRERGEARKESTHSSLVTHRQDDTQPRSAHLALPCPSSHSDAATTASCLCSAPLSLSFLYSRLSPGSTEVEKYLLLHFTPKGKKVKLNVETRNGIFIFIEKGISAESWEKTLRLSPL